MADCICDLGNIIDEESFNVRVIRELCDISNRLGTVELLRMVDQTDDGDVQFIRTTSGDFLLDGVTSYTPIGTVIPYKKSEIKILDHCFFDESPVELDFVPSSSWQEVSISFKLSSNSANNTFIFGSRTSSSASDRFYAQNQNSYNRLANSIRSSSGKYTSVSDLYKQIDWSYSNGNINVLNDGTTTTASVGTLPDGTYTIVIGGLHNGSAIPSARPKMYFNSFTVTENNVVIHNIVPAKDTSNVVCLYDTVTEQIYYPIAGTYLYEEEPPQLLMSNPRSSQINLIDDDELDVEPIENEEEER